MSDLLFGTCVALTQYFPTTLNHARCCLQPICTECFVQIQRVDPATHVPPTSQPAACPFCVAPDFGVVYQAKERTETNAQEAIEHAATAIGTGGAQAQGRASYNADDPRVVLVGTYSQTHPDHIHPNWKRKLDRALQNTARTENRRVIMRQDGDSLIPIGVSSSQTGDALASFVEHNSHLGHNGPGGSIVLHGYIFEQELQRQLQQHATPLQRARRSMDRSRTLQLSPEDLDEIILRETMRRSRLEHEEQRRQSVSEARPEPRTEQPRRLSLLPRRLANGAALKLKGHRSDTDDSPQQGTPVSQPDVRTPAASSSGSSNNVGPSTPSARTCPETDTNAVPPATLARASMLLAEAPSSRPLSHLSMATESTKPGSDVPAEAQAPAAPAPPPSRYEHADQSVLDDMSMSDTSQASAALGMKAWGHLDARPRDVPGTPTHRMSAVFDYEPRDASRSSTHPSTPSPRVRYALATGASSPMPAGMTTNPFRARASIEAQGP